MSQYVKSPQTDNIYESIDYWSDSFSRISIQKKHLQQKPFLAIDDEDTSNF